jgi:hypothetical protein
VIRVLSQRPCNAVTFATSEDCEVGDFANVRGRFRVYGFGAKREAMVGGSQGVRKV